MRAYIVCSSYASPKRILADDDMAALRQYEGAHVLNGGSPVTGQVKYRVYDDDEGGATVH